MKEKNIDELYRQKLHDYEELPDERVWQRIHESLDKKQKKRVVPIWWYYGGAAAIVVLALTLINPFANLSDTPPVDQQITERPSLEKATEERETRIIEQTSSITEETTQATSNEPKRKTNVQETGTTTTSYKNSLATTIQPSKIKASESNTSYTPNSQDANKTPNDPVAYNEQESNTKATSATDNLIQKELSQKTKKEETSVAESNQEDVKVLKELLPNEDDEKPKEKNNATKWAVGPSFAPVYFNSFGEGSPIDSDFITNTKSGKVNMSYGVSVAYELSKKLSLRSGVHRVTYGYNTEDISFTSSPSSINDNRIDNINYTRASRTVVVASKPNGSDAVSIAEIASQQSQFDGNMIQQMGYFEVPLELSYAIFDRKLGVNLIGGVSSLFLVDNSVALESQNLITEMGEANNLNTTNFSTNVGLGINYNFSNSLQFHFEPMFKYQLRTFSNAEGSFNPYVLGVYSGLLFKF